VDAAVEILHRRSVDSDGEMVTVPKVPDFLAVYGPDLDAFGHLEGTESPNIGSLVAELDRQLGRLVQATKEVGIYELTAFILTSDHGMTGWRQSFLEEFVATSGLGRGVELVPPGRPAASETEVVIVKSAGRIADVTLRGRARTPGRLAEVRRALEGLPQVDQVLGAADLEALRASDKVGDFLVETRTPWGFGLEEPEGGASRGGHGSTQEMRVPLLISGAGVRVGAVSEGARLVDVAPTVAALLGVRPPADAQGRVLDELLHG
jgi:arylsulfatase A-like enzyme